MKNKVKAKEQPKKSFVWGVSSESISFMHPKEVQAAREGSSSDCTGCSPLPKPERKVPRLKVDQV